MELNSWGIIPNCVIEDMKKKIQENHPYLLKFVIFMVGAVVVIVLGAVILFSKGDEIKQKVAEKAAEAVVETVVDTVADKAKEELKDKVLDKLLP